MKIPLKNLSILITGGGSGWGLTLCNRLIKEGAKLSVIDLKHENQCKYRYDKINNNQFNYVNHFVGDVTKDDLLTKIFQNKKLNDLDILVNCAGTRKGYNYLSSYLLSKHVYDKMINNNLNNGGCRGCIIQVAGMPTDEDEYVKEEQIYSSRVESLDEKVMKLAEDIVAARIRTNTIVIPDGCNKDDFSSLVENVIQDQSIVGQVITLETEQEKRLI